MATKKSNYEDKKFEELMTDLDSIVKELAEFKLLIRKMQNNVSNVYKQKAIHSCCFCRRTIGKRLLVCTSVPRRSGVPIRRRPPRWRLRGSAFQAGCRRPRLVCGRSGTIVSRCDAPFIDICYYACSFPLSSIHSPIA